MDTEKLLEFSRRYTENKPKNIRRLVDALNESSDPDFIQAVFFNVGEVGIDSLLRNGLQINGLMIEMFIRLFMIDRFYNDEIVWEIIRYMYLEHSKLIRRIYKTNIRFNKNYNRLRLNQLGQMIDAFSGEFGFRNEASTCVII